MEPTKQTKIIFLISLNLSHTPVRKYINLGQLYLPLALMLFPRRHSHRLLGLPGCPGSGYLHSSLGLCSVPLSVLAETQLMGMNQLSFCQ